LTPPSLSLYPLISAARAASEGRAVVLASHRAFLQERETLPGFRVPHARKMRLQRERGRGNARGTRGNSAEMERICALSFLVPSLLLLPLSPSLLLRKRLLRREGRVSFSRRGRVRHSETRDLAKGRREFKRRRTVAHLFPFLLNTQRLNLVRSLVEIILFIRAARRFEFPRPPRPRPDLYAAPMSRRKLHAAATLACSPRRAASSMRLIDVTP
jgi:hypothetical protein